jgi:aspartate/tyrosine/aromatic aminotransferase
MKFFETLPELPPDPLFGVQKAFEEDSKPNKVNLSVGTYKTDALQPYILPSVKAAESYLLEHEKSKDYLPITGLPDYIEATKRLVFAKNPSHLFGAQTVGGTSALRTAANFLLKAGHQKIYLSDPTWGNHPHIFKEAGFEIERYNYFEGLQPFTESSVIESAAAFDPHH